MWKKGSTCDRIDRNVLKWSGNVERVSLEVLTVKLYELCSKGEKGEKVVGAIQNCVQCGVTGTRRCKDEMLGRGLWWFFFCCLNAEGYGRGNDDAKLWKKLTHMIRNHRCWSLNGVDSVIYCVNPPSVNVDVHKNSWLFVKKNYQKFPSKWECAVIWNKQKNLSNFWNSVIHIVP